jgi:hypothetical protein
MTLTHHIDAIIAKVNDHTLNKVDISSIVDDLTTVTSDVPLSANQGKVLKDLIDGISAILQSDDGTLDELQEVVNYIKANRSTLEALTLDNIAETADKKHFTLDEKNKLAAIEEGATSDMTGAEIKVAYEGEADTNAYTDAEKLKLADTEITSQLDIRDTANRNTDNHTDGTINGVYTLAERTKLAAIDQEVATTSDVTFNTVNGRDIDVDGAKLDLIEDGATADQTDTEIKTAYENNADTNAYTDAEKTLVDVATALDTTSTTLPGAVNELKSTLSVNDAVASLTQPYSGSKTQDMHDTQQADIGTLTASILTLTSSSAQGEFGVNGLTLNINTTERVMPFNVITQSTNTDVFEITNGTGIIKEAGTYSFISTVEIEDIGADGDVATVTFNLRDTSTNAVYYTQSETVEISNFDRETIPFNSLMVIPDTMTLPVEIDINVVCSQSGYRVTGFKSIVSASVANASITRGHNTLLGRGEPEAHPASAISVALNGNLSSVNVQLALETIYEEVYATVEW